MAGAGYTGLRLARRLQPRWRVIALARSEAAASRLSAAGLEVLRADPAVEGVMPRAECYGLVSAGGRSLPFAGSWA